MLLLLLLLLLGGLVGSREQGLYAEGVETSWGDAQVEGGGPSLVLFVADHVDFHLPSTSTLARTARRGVLHGFPQPFTCNRRKQFN
jgi:hypothetical protein